MAVGGLVGSDRHWPATSAFAAPPLYWCPNRFPDQQYGATREPGCVPLVGQEQKDRPPKDDEAKAHPPIKLGDIQAHSSAFLQQHRHYLACCATNPGSLDDLEELDDRASDILKTAQAGLSSEKMKLRGFTLSEMISPVARARDQLREIKKRLQRIEEANGRVDQLDYESAGRERRRIQEAEESITKDFGQKAPAPSPKTGTEIGQTPPSGPQIGHVLPTEPDFGASGRTGLDLGYTPPTVGKGIGLTPPTGFEIGGTGLTGPTIGESDLNRRPSASESTLSGSSVSSGMWNRRPGSTLGPSTVGSDLQSRPAAEPSDVPLSTVGASLKGRTP
jgi:hypothetical protein